jgi:hypothetical protein
VKSAVSLLALAALSLTACNTLVTRKDLYSPVKGDGPYTKARRDSSWRVWRDGSNPGAKKATSTTKVATPAAAGATTTTTTATTETEAVEAAPR